MSHYIFNAQKFNDEYTIVISKFDIVDKYESVKETTTRFNMNKDQYSQLLKELQGVDQ